MKKIKIEKGAKYNMLTIIKEVKPKRLPSGQINRVILCECDCGNKKDIRLLHLIRNRIKSCGCASGEQHNMTNSHLYNIWRGMKNRVKYNAIDSHRYYSRGIKIYDKWEKSFTIFMKWALKNGYNHNLQIDRIDNSKGYYPNNCRFVTPEMNVNNRDNTYIVTYKDIDYPFMELIRFKNLLANHNTIRARLKRGWSVNKAFDTPIRKIKELKND